AEHRWHADGERTLVAKHRPEGVRRFLPFGDDRIECPRLTLPDLSAGEGIASTSYDGITPLVHQVQALTKHSQAPRHDVHDDTAVVRDDVMDRPARTRWNLRGRPF